MNRQPEVLQITAAISVLCIGVLVYVIDRQAEFVYFLPGWFSFNSVPSVFFGSVGNYLPTFILLSVVVSAPSIIKLVPVCLAWLTLDSLCEVAQLDSIVQWIGSHTPYGSAASRFSKILLISS
jgi:hypothetical protein